MRLVRFETQPGFGARVGIQVDNRIDELPSDLPGTIEALLKSGPDGIAHAARRPPAAVHELASVRLLAPLAAPSKILAVGLNYQSHLLETGLEAPEEPTVFSKLASSITGPADPIVLPNVAPRRVDYEAELAVVIARYGRDVPVERAMDWVAGYTVANDVTARDWQLKKPNGQWLLGKSFDTFLPLGPALVTADEGSPPDAMAVRCVVSGETMQSAGTDELLFGVPELVAYVSQVCTLAPGDLILTGTPGGVGMARDPRRFLAAGDLVECTVDGIGTIANPVEASPGESGAPAPEAVAASALHERRG